MLVHDLRQLIIDDPACCLQLVFRYCSERVLVRMIDEKPPASIKNDDNAIILSASQPIQHKGETFFGQHNFAPRSDLAPALQSIKTEPDTKLLASVETVKKPDLGSFEGRYDPFEQASASPSSSNHHEQPRRNSLIPSRKSSTEQYSQVVRDYVESKSDEQGDQGEEKLFVMALCGVLERAEIPILEEELAHLYDETLELGQDSYRSQLESFGVSSLSEVLSRLYDDRFEVNLAEGVTVKGIRMNESTKTLDGKAAVFYYNDIDELDHEWLTNADFYLKKRADGTLERWIDQLVNDYNQKTQKMDSEQAQNILMRRWQTR